MHRVHLLVATLMATALPLHAHATGFDWGDACSEGDGSFNQYIAHQADETVGEIPAGKSGVEITLVSQHDVDIRLVDQATGHEIVAWPDGDLNGAGEACTLWEGVNYCYSGYNGDGTNYGHEWIRVDGETNRPLVMTAFGYASGTAAVEYQWQAPDDCVDAGDGAFSQYVPHQATVLVGDIPAGKGNVDIALTAAAGRDVDVQLWDGTTAIIAWPNGLLNGPEQQTVDYQDLRVTWSGYNGRDGDWGAEDIRISGVLPDTLTMKVYGYQAGDADVVYSWGHGQLGDSCGGRTVIPAHGCLDGLVCQGPGLASDRTGTCQPAVSPITEVSLGSLVADPASYAGQLVTVTDVVSSTLAMCTKMACSVTNPCCNACSANLQFQHGGTSVQLGGLSCPGNECTWEANCPYAAGTWATVTGTVVVDTFGGSTSTRIEVTDHEAFTPPTCHVGGCSGQICSDMPGAISTCEVQPWYACLPETTCGNHGLSGACAWQPTEAYETCLDDVGS